MAAIEQRSAATNVGARPIRLPLSMLQLAVLLPLAAVYLWVALAVRGAHAFSGDEPHYLAITQSLWLYHTLDQHNVLYHHDFFAYFDRLMSSHSVHRGGHLYPLHFPGLPLILLPGFALAGAAGAQVTAVLIAVLVLWRALDLATRHVSPIPAAVAVGVLGLSAPFVLNAGAIYPDMLSALLLILAYEALDTAVFSAKRALALGLVLAACPWVHVKLLVAVAVYLAWAGYLLWCAPHNSTRSTHKLRTVVAGTAAAIGLPLLSLGALMLYNQALYGSPSPAAPYNGPTLFTGNPLGGLIGQIFAEAQGALGTAPFVWLVLPGALVLLRRDRSSALKIALATLPFWLVTLTYRDWWGGDAPPLRYLLPMLPLWAVAIAALLAERRAIAGYVSAGILTVATLAITSAIPVAQRLGWPLPSGQGALLLTLGTRLHLPLATWLPVFEPTRTGPGLWHRAELIVPWGLVLVALSWIIRDRSKEWQDAGMHPPKKSSHSPFSCVQKKGDTRE